MARRIIEEDTTPVVDRTTYVDNDASWAGQTIALIAVVVLLIVGAIWLVNSLADNDTSPTIQNPGNEAPANPGDTDTGTDTNTDTNTDTVPVPVPQG